MAECTATRLKGLNKGGGYKGGPRRGSGRGPAPARHIPWPELFKHHISLIEGHQKMIDMVRKHTIEGTGNHRTICDMLDRCKTMMYESKQISRTFVPPSNQRDKVPLGSSSASMYPGYSPADHIYGNAAMAAGAAAAAAKKAGLPFKPSVDIDYEVGQGKGLKRKKLAEMRAAKGSQGDNGSGSRSGTDTSARAVNGHSQAAKVADTKTAEPKPAQEATESEQPAFFVDTKPTPVNLPLAFTKCSKRMSPDPEPTEEATPKKMKKKHDGDIPAAPKPGQIETEDISAEVNKRMKDKEERRKLKEEQKKEKKRKRDTEDSSQPAAEASSTVVEGETPKKKKSKKNPDAKEVEEASKKRPADDQEAGDDGEGKKKKRKQHQVEAEVS